MARHWVLHVDLDEFIAAVEVRRRPELAGRPVVVGGRGDPTERGVVATASYEAREHGVGSGMPLRLALRKCPHAVFLPMDMPAYLEASEEVMAVLRGMPVVVEVLGMDEAFVGAASDDPRALAEEVRARVLAGTGLHCSVGIGDNRLRAKIATSFGKPRGIGMLTATDWFEVMGERPTDALWGIGRRTARRLAELGIHTVGDLAAADVAELAERLGPRMGPWYHRLGRGEASATVDAAPWAPRGRGHETTFQEDLAGRDQVAAEVRRLAARVAADISADGRVATRVGLKVRFAPFFTTTRSLTLPAPTREPEVIGAAALDLLGRIEDDRPVRLVGVRVELSPPG